jgi:hypothetical protein
MDHPDLRQIDPEIDVRDLHSNFSQNIRSLIDDSKQKFSRLQERSKSRDQVTHQHVYIFRFLLIDKKPYPATSSGKDTAKFNTNFDT